MRPREELRGRYLCLQDPQPPSGGAERSVSLGADQDLEALAERVLPRMTQSRLVVVLARGTELGLLIPAVPLSVLPSPAARAV